MCVLNCKTTTKISIVRRGICVARGSNRKVHPQYIKEHIKEPYSFVGHSLFCAKHIINVQSLYFLVVYPNKRTVVKVGRYRRQRKLFKLRDVSIFNVEKRESIVVTVRCYLQHKTQQDKELCTKRKE